MEKKTKPLWTKDEEADLTESFKAHVRELKEAFPQGTQAPTVL